MARCTKATSLLAAAGICSIACLIGVGALSDPLPPDTTYRPLPTRPLSAVKTDDEAQKPQVMARQSDLLNQRYDREPADSGRYDVWGKEARAGRGQGEAASRHHMG